MYVHSPNQVFWSDVSAQMWGSAIAVFCVWYLVVGRGLPLLYSSISSCGGEGSLRVTLWLLGQAVAMFSSQQLSWVFLSLSGGICLTGPQRVGSMVSLLGGASECLIPPSVCSRPRHIVADTLSRPNRIFGDEWPLLLEVLGVLRRRWSVSSFRFLPLFFLAVVFFCAGVGFHGCGCRCHAPVMGFFCMLVHFQPFAIIPQVLVHLWSFPGSVLSLVAPSLDAACRMLGFSFFFHVLQLHACHLSSSLSGPPASFDARSADWLCETLVLL